MKILITSMISIEKIHPRTYVFKKMVESLGTKTSVESYWILCQPDEIPESTLSPNTFDIHSYSNGVDLLKKNKPDLILIDSQIEPIQYAISLAAKNLKIPIIARPPLADYFPMNTVKSSIISKIRNFFSSQVPSDDEKNKKFLRRGNFFMYKLKFLILTKLALKQNFFTVFFSTLYYLRQIVLTRSQLPLNPLIDLHLLASEAQISNYKKKNIQDSKLKLVGNIWVDRLFEKISQLNYEIKNDNIRILIITTPYFEHGFWTSNQRDDFLTKLLTILKNNTKFKISIKIHPTSENRTYYQNLLQSIDFPIPIFQSEDLWSLIPNYDIFISYGSAQALGDLAFSQKRTISISVGQSLQDVPLVKKAILSDFIVECKHLDNLLNAITSIINSSPKPNDEYLAERKKIFYNFDGKSAERTANIILSFLNNKS
jgi:hypothetical protein